MTVTQNHDSDPDEVENSSPEPVGDDARLSAGQGDEQDVLHEAAVVAEAQSSDFAAAQMQAHRQRQQMEQQQVTLAVRGQAIGAAMATVGGGGTFMDGAGFDLLLARAERIAGFLVAGVDPNVMAARQAVASVAEMLDRNGGQRQP